MGLMDFLFGKNGTDSTKQALGLWDELNPPSPEEQQIILQQYVDQGKITPEQAQAQLVQSNAYDSMNLDTEGKDAQLQALRQMSEIGNEGGLTASDKSKLRQIQNEEQTTARGANEAIIQNAQQRGMGGSGLEMLQRMKNQQDSATRQSNKDLDVAAMGQERALQAMQQAGALGGNINQQQFGQQQAIANSKNAIEQFNAANKQQTNMANTNANNQAQAANLAAKQATANSNVDLQNQQNTYNKGLAQQNFQNQASVVQGKANALGSQAAQQNQNQAGNKGLFGSLLGAGAVAFSDEDVKKDVEDFNAGDFLDSLTSNSWKYKDPSMGEGKHVGPMAQDIEKEVPQMVQDTPRGKMVDYSPGKAGGPILAGLSDIHERLKRIEGK